MCYCFSGSARVVGARQMTSQPVSSIFVCSQVPSGIISDYCTEFVPRKFLQPPSTYNFCTFKPSTKKKKKKKTF